MKHRDIIQKIYEIPDVEQLEMFSQQLEILMQEGDLILDPMEVIDINCCMEDHQKRQFKPYMLN